MSLALKNTDDLIELALKTSSLDDMLFLTKNPSMIVRRSLSKNININQEIINYLLNDPVLNVSYIAYKNPNNKNLEKKYDINLRPCVICETEEKFLDCENCELLKNHNF